MTTLLNKEVQDFIDDNLDSDVTDLILKYSEIGGVSMKIIVEQIQSKRKAKAKLPEWFKTSGIIFPPVISMEQCSSSITGKFKSKLFHGKKALDLTGGAGADTFFLSQRFNSVDYVEIDQKLCMISKLNFQVLGANNIRCFDQGAGEFLGNSKEKYDLIYLDPSRRQGKKKVFSLQDSEPDFLGLQKSLRKSTSNILLKTSPLLDIQKCLKDIEDVKKVIVVGVNNEVKEVLYHIGESSLKNEVVIEAININNASKSDQLSFTYEEEHAIQPYFGSLVATDYLYEPNNSILKAGAFKSVAKKWGITKLGVNTHLYSSKDLKRDFQGRIFKILKAFPSFSKAEKELGKKKLNIISRNYPLKPEDLKRKLRSKDGGEQFLIATEVDQSGKSLILCDRIK